MTPFHEAVRDALAGYDKLQETWASDSWVTTLVDAARQWLEADQHAEANKCLGEAIKASCDENLQWYQHEVRLLTVERDRMGKMLDGMKSAITKAAEAEREACARVAGLVEPPINVVEFGQRYTLLEFATRIFKGGVLAAASAIRARSKEEGT